MAVLCPAIFYRDFDNAGNPLAFGLVYTYAAGTSNPQATFTDVTGLVPNTNPIQLNVRGESEIWLNPVQSYKFVVTDALGNPIRTVDSIGANLNTSLVPSIDNTYDLGSPTFRWRNGYFGTALTAPTINATTQLNIATFPVYESSTGIIGYYGISAAETAASITPTHFSYPWLDLRRYGGDPTGVADSTTAFNSLFLVMLNMSGASAVVPPGTYKITGSGVVVTMTPASGPSSATHGLALYGYGVVLNYTGASYALDFLSPNESATFYQPALALYGINVLATPAAAGGFRSSDMSNGRYVDCAVNGATAGAAFTLRNSVHWSELNRFLGCSATGCSVGIAFITAGGTNSFARTQVDHFFGSGISNFWFDIGPGTSVYSSRFTNISGNFTSLAIMAIGSASGPTSADMTDTVIDGVDVEQNAVPAGQSIIRLRDYPEHIVTAKRPRLYNVGALVLFPISIPIWADNTGAAVQLEAEQTQPVKFQTQAQQMEPNYGFNGAMLPIPTFDENHLFTVTVNGFAGAVTGRVNFYRVGGVAMMVVYDPLTGTSNTTSLTITGIPAEFIPSGVNSAYAPAFVTNNGNNNQPALYSIAPTTGTITFSIATAFNTYSTTGFTASGTKGVASGLVMWWPLID